MRQRITIIAVIGVTTLAAATATRPAFAAPVDPNETAATPQQCEMYQQWFNDEAKKFWKDAFGGSSTAVVLDDAKDAQYTINLAKRRGCDWAQDAVAPSAPPVAGPVRVPGPPPPAHT